MIVVSSTLGKISRLVAHGYKRAVPSPRSFLHLVTTHHQSHISPLFEAVPARFFSVKTSSSLKAFQHQLDTTSSFEEAIDLISVRKHLGINLLGISRAIFQ